MKEDASVVGVAIESEGADEGFREGDVDGPPEGIDRADSEDRATVPALAAEFEFPLFARMGFKSPGGVRSDIGNESAFGEQIARAGVASDDVGFGAIVADEMREFW